jgi:hypothetical protein
MAERKTNGGSKQASRKSQLQKLKKKSSKKPEDLVANLKPESQPALEDANHLDKTDAPSDPEGNSPLIAE